MQTVVTPVAGPLMQQVTAVALRCDAPLSGPG